MRERDREIRRRRHRREKTRKARIRALIAQAGVKIAPANKPAEVPQEEKKVIHKKAPVKLVRPAKTSKKKVETGKKGE